MADEYNNVEVKSSPAWQLPAIVMLGLIAIGGLAFGWNASSKLMRLSKMLHRSGKTMQTSLTGHVFPEGPLGAIRKDNTDFQGDLKVVTGKLKITQGQLKKAREEAAKANEDTNTKIQRFGYFRSQRTGDQGATDDLKERGHQSRWRSHRSRYHSRRPQMARSEMGTLIARNHDEIDQLRRLGRARLRGFTLPAEQAADGGQRDGRTQGRQRKEGSVSVN